MAGKTAAGSEPPAEASVPDAEVAEQAGHGENFSATPEAREDAPPGPGGATDGRPNAYAGVPQPIVTSEAEPIAAEWGVWASVAEGTEASDTRTPGRSDHETEPTEPALDPTASLDVTRPELEEVPAIPEDGTRRDLESAAGTTEAPVAGSDVTRTEVAASEPTLPDVVDVPVDVEARPDGHEVQSAERPEQDWLVARLEQAEAAHFGTARQEYAEPTGVGGGEALDPEPEAAPSVAAAGEAEAGAIANEPVAENDTEAPEALGSGAPSKPVAVPLRDEGLDAGPDGADARPDAVIAPPVRSEDARAIAKRVVRYAAYAAAGYLGLVLALIVVYRFVNPPASTLMIYEGLFGAGAERTWVDIENISPHLIRAVVVAEDGRFCDHYGIDLIAMEDAIEQAADGIPRGASTISMQVTKNLFLWHSKSFIRKLIELPLTLVIELLWPKSRILEVYLNIAEWGPGIFGAEAAAQHHFGRSAADLNEHEAARLAAALPNPIRRDAGDPGPRLLRKAAKIQSRARASGNVVYCLRTRRSEP